MSWFATHQRGETMIVSVFGEIGSDGVGAAEFSAAIGQSERLELFITDCPGGSATCAMKIHDFLLRHGNVSATLSGVVASSAITLAIAAAHVVARPNTQLLVHAINDATLGDAATHREKADELDRLNVELAELYRRRLKVEGDMVQRWLSGGDHWLDVNEALRAGFIDEVIEEPTDQVAAVNDSPSASPSVVDEDGSEALFYDLVRAIGPIRVRDRARFARNLNFLLHQQVSELPRSACAVSEAGSPAPSAGEVPGESFSTSTNP